MGFLDFIKKEGKLSKDIDLDMPPLPPKGMKARFSEEEEPIDEELMALPKKEKKAGLKAKLMKAREPALPGLPPLPEEEEIGFPEMPPLPEEGMMGGKESKTKKEKKGLFSFLKAKKEGKEMKIPKMEERIPEIPELPEFEAEEKEEQEFPKMPEMPKAEFPLRKEEPIIAPIEPRKEAAERPVATKAKEPKIKRPTKKFITINDFKDINRDIRNIKEALKQADDAFLRLDDAHDKGNKEYEGLNSSLRDIQMKIMFIDKSIFEKEV